MGRNRDYWKLCELSNQIILGQSENESSPTRPNNPTDGRTGKDIVKACSRK